MRLACMATSNGRRAPPEYIKNGEYAYLSPVFPYASGTGEVLDLLHVGLTNTPGIDAPIHAALSALRARFLLPLPQGVTKEIDAMDLKALLLAAGLPETATEAEALTALAALKAKADGADAAQTQLAALKAAAPRSGQVCAGGRDGGGAERNCRPEGAGAE